MHIVKLKDSSMSLINFKNNNPHLAKTELQEVVVNWPFKRTKTICEYNDNNTVNEYDVIEFENKEDAVLFQLTYGGEE